MANKEHLEKLKEGVEKWNGGCMSIEDSPNLRGVSLALFGSLEFGAAKL